MYIIDLLKDPDLPKKKVLEKLICHVCKISPAALFASSETELTDEQLQQIKQGYNAYAEDDTPLEYILGYVEFLGIRFTVTPATLIPRPETEYMIKAVNEFVQATNQTFTVVDIGTGCGVLGLSTLYHNPDRIDQLVLTELSEDALKVAKENYVRLFEGGTETEESPPLVQGGVGDMQQAEDFDFGGIQKAQNLDLNNPPCFLTANLLDHPKLEQLLTSNDNLIIVANLPYIPDEMFDQNVEDNVKKREPKMAFVGGDDGLDLYRELFEQLLFLLKKSPLAPLCKGGAPQDCGAGGSTRDTLTLFLEMMTRQVDILREAYGDSFTFQEVKTFHFNIRIVKVTPVPQGDR